jgi:phosphoglycolate phosphatase-like HAD superfamily hydrolase
MVRHICALGVDATDVVMVGDSVDDAVAARHAGARAILYTGGMQARVDLDRFGVPVIDRLADVAVHI